MTARGQVSLPDPATLRRFDVPGPRYTSYPTADRFVEAFETGAFAEALAARQSAVAAASLSLYVHLPFCSMVCYYCACNKVITKDQSKAGEYIGYLEREADLVRGLLTGSREIEQLHFGGGTPTFLTNDELARLMAILTERFPLGENGEFSIEVDPRSTPPDKVAELGRLGFNRMSVGVQDFEPEVQRAVNRLQSFEMTQATVDAARRADFKSVNLDLIYGLPNQTRETFARTLDKVMVLSPERIALYHYAHLPDRFKPQRRIDSADLPSPEEKLNIMLDAIRRLSDAGYHYIGMDHFAKTSDDLARAQRQGRLHRNFQGYSTRPDCDLLGLGISAISKIGPTYSQNVRTVEEYYDRLSHDLLPTARGIALDRDDILRRAVIMSLMCHFEVSKESIETVHMIKFDDYFKTEIAELRMFEDEGLVENTAEWISVTPKGKLLVRAVAMTFDRYLRADRRARRYSKIV
ncbi:MAG TPA: oxygen-independent coproporphyrinogen III oxidase [Burkholderiaceae bacterium]|nr:oxygen-independent coproporphyrinogen III oxidase [Burkholderiaceae bacterium]